ncbi:MAG: ATP-binding protein [Acutalibacteraceae bacterium]
MKYSEIIYAQAENILKERRTNAEELLEKRKKEFTKKYPELTDIEDTMKNAALQVIRSISSGGGKVSVDEIAKKNLEAQKLRKELIVNAGYPEDYLDPPYTCKICNDTGIYNGKLCKCHLELLRQLSVSTLSCSSVLASSTFDTFDLSYYSDKKDPELGISHKAIMAGTKAMLKSYAENFSKSSNSLFFTGGTGLGKTHLALAVLNTVTANGFNVYYDSAGNIIKKMQKENFGRGDSDIDEELEKCDLLIMDDLGAELSTPFSVVSVNDIVNNAVMSGKPIIIVSNLGKSELEERYGQRLTSRLGGFEVLNFYGEDIRSRK